MSTWVWITICLCWGCAMFVLGAWWRCVWADEPMVEVYNIPADDVYGKACQHLMEGR